MKVWTSMHLLNFVLLALNLQFVIKVVKLFNYYNIYEFVNIWAYDADLHITRSLNNLKLLKKIFDFPICTLLSDHWKRDLFHHRPLYLTLHCVISWRTLGFNRHIVVGARTGPTCATLARLISAPGTVIKIVKTLILMIVIVWEIFLQ